MNAALLRRYKEMGVDELPECTLKTCIRVNTLKISEKELVARLKQREVTLQKVPFLDNAYFAEAEFSLGAMEEHLLGLFYIQEAASQLPVQALKNILGSLEDLYIVDLAAAPGSKTTQLGAAMNNTGRLIAIDENMNRIKSLTNNLERLGVTNCFAYVKNATYAEDLPQNPDVVLLDAPCSGNYCLSPKWLGQRNVQSFTSKAVLQRELLEKAYALLRPGGVLLYSTCSLEPEEDECVLQTLPSEAQIIPTKLSVGDEGLASWQRELFREDMVHARRFWPHKVGTQGFFLAAIKKPE